jgi:hypothetical protein
MFQTNFLFPLSSFLKWRQQFRLQCQYLSVRHFSFFGCVCIISENLLRTSSVHWGSGVKDQVGTQNFFFARGGAGRGLTLRLYIICVRF